MTKIFSLLLAACLFSSIALAGEVTSARRPVIENHTYMGCSVGGTLDDKMPVQECYTRIRPGKFHICQARALDCRATAKTCKQHDRCMMDGLKKLNGLVISAMQQTDGDLMFACIETRNDLEDITWAHYTTIECTDTPKGPQFGG